MVSPDTQIPRPDSTDRVEKFIESLSVEDQLLANSAETLCIILKLDRTVYNYRRIMEMLKTHREDAVRVFKAEVKRLFS